MKKDFIFTPIMLFLAATLFLLDYTGLPVHIAVSVLGIFVLAVSMRTEFPFEPEYKDVIE